MALKNQDQSQQNSSLMAKIILLNLIFPEKKSFSYQCILRAPVCKFLIYIPLENNYDEALELIDQDQINGIFTLNEYSQLCN